MCSKQNTGRTTGTRRDTHHGQYKGTHPRASQGRALRCYEHAPTFPQQTHCSEAAHRAGTQTCFIKMSNDPLHRAPPETPRAQQSRMASICEWYQPGTSRVDEISTTISCKPLVIFARIPRVKTSARQSSEYKIIPLASRLA